MSFEIAGYMLLFLWSACWLGYASLVALGGYFQTVKEAERRGVTVTTGARVWVLLAHLLTFCSLFAIPWSILPGAYWLAVWAAS